MKRKFFKEIYLATLLVKRCLGTDEYLFEVLGVMLGTIDFKKKVFINNHDREYLEMNDEDFFKSEKRYCFYNSISLEDFSKENNNESDINKLVEKYNEKYQGVAYYFYGSKNDDYFIIAFDKGKLKKIDVQETIARKVNGGDW